MHNRMGRKLPDEVPRTLRNIKERTLRMCSFFPACRGRLFLMKSTLSAVPSARMDNKCPHSIKNSTNLLPLRRTSSDPNHTALVRWVTAFDVTSLWYECMIGRAGVVSIKTWALPAKYLHNDVNNARLHHTELPNEQPEMDGNWS